MRAYVAQHPAARVFIFFTGDPIPEGVEEALASASQVGGRLGHGGVLLVPVKVQGQDFEFLVDTGSAYNAMSRDLIGLLGIAIDPDRVTAIDPAHGTIIKVPLITVAELSIEGFRSNFSINRGKTKN